MSLLWTAILLANSVAPVQGRADDEARAAAGADVRAVLREGSYPWYDADRDRVRPVMSDPSSWPRRLTRRIESFLEWLLRSLRREDVGPDRGDVGRARALPTLIMLGSGALFVYLLWRLWRLHSPRLDAEAVRRSRIGEAARVAGLAPGLLEGSDPWEEAMRRRQTDPGGAVVWLFLHQLLSLERAGLIRLTPGKTARQYARSLEDPALASGLQATLGAFEDVYYGHRPPSREALVEVWARAEAFRRRLQLIGGS